MAVKKKAFKMTEDQKRLFDKLKPLQKEVASNSISGMNDVDAYKASKGKAKTYSAQRAGASEILSNPNVKAFIDSMKDVKISDAIASRDEVMEFHSRMMRLDVSDLSTLTLEELTEVKGGIDTKLRAAQNAAKMLADLAGYNKPTEVNLTHKKADEVEW